MTKADRKSKKIQNKQNNEPTSAYYMMTKAVADIHKLSTQEKESLLPSVAPLWNKPTITAFMNLNPCKKPAKDKRVD